MFRFTVMFAAVLLMTGLGAQAENLIVKKLKYFNACPRCDSTGANLSGVNLEGASL